jgi:hypothetical protein
MTNSVIQLPKGNQPAVAPVSPVEPVQPLTPVITVATTAAPALHWQPPIFGSLVLAPLALLMAVAAGIFRQIPWAIIGGASATVALATSKYFWALLGLAWLINRVGWLWG